MGETPEPAAMGRTTIAVDESTADELHALKRRGESYDDVIQRLLERDGDE